MAVPQSAADGDVGHDPGTGTRTIGVPELEMAECGYKRTMGKMKELH